uniref:Uncharacterized protein n=1 Tax=Sipha flava TaxID=143950 RepID=A0A2S2PWQ8_9HEMI
MLLVCREPPYRIGDNLETLERKHSKSNQNEYSPRTMQRNHSTADDDEIYTYFFRNISVIYVCACAPYSRSVKNICPRNCACVHERAFSFSLDLFGRTKYYIYSFKYRNRWLCDVTRCN